MSSGSVRRFLFIAMLVVVFAVWPRTASGFSPSTESDRGVRETQARLSEGFRQILGYFEQHDLSLLVAWREMRASGDPDFFERSYPGISRELDAWSSSLEKQFGVNGDAASHMDFTFLLEELGPVALAPDEMSVRRDNAV